MNKSANTGLARIAHAFGYSLKGLAAAWQFEAAFRQEVILGIMMVPLAYWLASSHIELVLLLASILWVWMAELANSALETVVDRLGMEMHELSGRAKDIGSALVFISLVLLAMVWGLIAFNRFWN